ncbi:MAG: toprim domain-containing protein [Stellaceae bacterium]
MHGFDTSVALAWSRRWLGISEDGRRPRYPAKPSPQKAAEPDAEAKQARALDIWANAVPVDGTSAEHYLRSRGLDPEKLYSLTGPRSWPATLRYSERVALNPGQLCRALIIAVHCGHLGSVRSIQRVLLNRDGTAVRDSRGRRMKLSLGPIRGNAAMFDYWPDSEGRWGLAEGPETALAAYSLTGIPTWAAIAAGNMHQVVPPSWARHAVIFSDNDNVGMAAAAKALQAIQSRPGIESVRIAATTSGNDAADLNSRAH